MIFFEQGLERKHRSPAGQFEQWGCCKNKQQNIRSCLGFSAGLLLAAVVLKPYFLPWCSGGVLCHTPRVPKDLWHRQVQERSVAPPTPPHTPQSSWKLPNFLYFKLCDLGQMLLHLGTVGPPCSPQIHQVLLTPIQGCGISVSFRWLISSQQLGESHSNSQFLPQSWLSRGN